MKLLVFFMGTFNFLLTFQQFVSCHLDLKKYLKTILNNFVIFRGWG
jgi:hypothetical protein